MRFLHISDLHIGLKLLNRDLTEDQNYIMDQVVEKAAEVRPEALVIAGDIYDKAVPSAEAVEIFDRFITALTTACPGMVIMIISGNHDSAPRIDCFRSILSRQNVHMIGVPPQNEGEFIAQVQLEDAFGPVHFYLLPFVKPSVVKRITGVDEKGNNLSYDEALHRLLAREQLNTQERNVLASHQFYLPSGTKAEEVDRAESEIHMVGNIDQVSAEVLRPFDYAALGHIHKPMTVGDRVYRYSGTPLACSVSEAGQQKGMILVELGPKGTVETTVLPLKPLRRVRIIQGTLKEVLQQSCGDYVRIVLTDKVDLNVFDMQDQLREAFPYLLEVRREGQERERVRRMTKEHARLSAYELCLHFMSDLDEETEAVLKEVVSAVQEEVRS